MKHNKYSKTVWFKDDDIEAHLIVDIFKSTDFEYSPMTGKPLKFEYQDLLNNLKWSGLPPQDYIKLLKAMCKTFINSLPTS